MPNTDKLVNLDKNNFIFLVKKQEEKVRKMQEINEEMYNNYEQLRLSLIEKNSKYINEKRSLPANKEWVTSEYSYNRIDSKLSLPTKNKVDQLIKSYFNLSRLSKGKKSKRIEVRFRRLSLNRIFVSKSEIKYSNNKVIVTIYTYNREKKLLLLKKNKLHINNLNKKVNKSSSIYNTKNQRIKTRNKKIRTRTNKKIKTRNKKIKTRNKKINIINKKIKTKFKKIKNIRRRRIKYTQKYRNSFIRKVRLANLKSARIIRKIKRVKKILLKSLYWKKGNFNIYEFKYYKHFLIKLYKKQIISLFYEKNLYCNNNKFKNWFLVGIKSILSNIYKRKVEINVVDLKYLHYNSDNLTNAVSIKLRDRNNRLLRVLKKAIHLTKTPLIGSAIMKKPSFLFDHSFTSGYNNIFTKETLKKNYNIDKSIFLSSIETFKEFYSFKTLANNKVLNWILKTIKYKIVNGVRLEGAGRLSKRLTASRSVFKYRDKGSLKDINSSYENLSSSLSKGYAKPNVEQTNINSKTRNGAFGLKISISGYTGPILLRSFPLITLNFLPSYSNYSIRKISFYTTKIGAASRKLYNGDKEWLKILSIIIFIILIYKVFPIYLFKSQGVYFISPVVTGTVSCIIYVLKTSTSWNVTLKGKKFALVFISSFIVSTVIMLATNLILDIELFSDIINITIPFLFNFFFINHIVMVENSGVAYKTIISHYMDNTSGSSSSRGVGDAGNSSTITNRGDGRSYNKGGAGSSSNRGAGLPSSAVISTSDVTLSPPITNTGNVTPSSAIASTGSITPSAIANTRTAVTSTEGFIPYSVRAAYSKPGAPVYVPLNPSIDPSNPNYIPLKPTFGSSIYSNQPPTNNSPIYSNISSSSNVTSSTNIPSSSFNTGGYAGGYPPSSSNTGYFGVLNSETGVLSGKTGVLNSKTDVSVANSDEGHSKKKLDEKLLQGESKKELTETFKNWKSELGALNDELSSTHFKLSSIKVKHLVDCTHDKHDNPTFSVNDPKDLNPKGVKDITDEMHMLDKKFKQLKENFDTIYNTAQAKNESIGSLHPEWNKWLNQTFYGLNCKYNDHRTLISYYNRTFGK